MVNFGCGSPWVNTICTRRAYVWRICDSQEGVAYLTSLATGCVPAHEEHGTDTVGSGDGISEYDAMVGNGQRRTVSCADHRAVPAVLPAVAPLQSCEPYNIRKQMSAQPTSWGSISQGMPDLRTKMIPVRAARSGIHGRPPFGLGCWLARAAQRVATARH